MCVFALNSLVVLLPALSQVIDAYISYFVPGIGIKFSSPTKQFGLWAKFAVSGFKKMVVSFPLKEPFISMSADS